MFGKLFRCLLHSVVYRPLSVAPRAVQTYFKVIKKLINQNKMSTEDQEQTKQIINGTLPSVLSVMQKFITEFKNGMRDYIDKILKEKLPPST